VLPWILAAGEPSKVPFYIAGGGLAVYAVVLAGLGLTRPSFPYGERGARGVMLLSFVLIVIAMGTAIATSR
jgi:hypothetical protein